MARYNAKEITWEKIEVLGKECLFYDLRVDRNTVPEGYFMYEVRHADEDWGEPCEIALGILVNFYGTLLSKEPFDLEPSNITTNAYLYIDWKTDWYYLDERVKLEERP